MKKIYLLLVYILAIFFIIQFSYAKWTPYTPYYSYDQIMNASFSGCAPPGTVTGCSMCNVGFKQDCSYYFASRASDCDIIYSKVNEQESCYYFVFNEKLKSEDDISPTCGLMKSDFSKYRCISDLVPDYGKVDLCDGIPRDPKFVSFRADCINNHAKVHSDPEECGLIDISPYNALGCCLDIKYQLGDQYIITRKELVDAFMAKYSEQFKDCETVTKTAAPKILDKCEQINCDCLDPCNKVTGDDQFKCATACSMPYINCYGAEKTELVDDKLQMYLMQSFYGQFSRKHCAGHSVMPDSAGDTADYTISGRITNAEGYPMPYMLIEANISKGKYIYNTITNEKGEYFISLPGLTLGAGETSFDGDLKLEFSYYRDGINVFNMLYNKAGTDNYYYSYLYKKVKISNEKDQVIDIQLDNTLDSNSFDATAEKVKILSTSYYRFAQAVEYSKYVLGADISKSLPLDIYVGKQGDKAFYTSDGGYIVLEYGAVHLGVPDRPKNLEYHEFSHYVQNSQYKGWPADKQFRLRNHLGYANPNTADSFTEGFAEFNAMQMGTYFNDNKDAPDVYAEFGSMENNYKTWDGRGSDEELAIVSLLWDLHDKENDGESMELSTEQIWDWLKVNRANFYEYYKALKVAYPSQAGEIDKLFILHGFYFDNTTGNKKLDKWDPYYDANGDHVLNGNDFYVDMPTEPANMSYADGMVIGQATTYQRPNRGQTVTVPNAFLKIDDTRVRLYTITVKLSTGRTYSYVSDVRNGLLYVQPLPDDVKAELTITSNSSAYTVSNPYTISNSELISKVYSSQSGYYDNYTFELKATGIKTNDTWIDTQAEPAYVPDDDSIKINVTKINSPPELANVVESKNSNTLKGSGLGSTTLIAIIVAVLIIVVVVFLLLRNSRHKKHEHNK